MTSHDVAGSDIDVDRDAFVRTILSSLVGSLDDVVGGHDARGFVSVAGQAVAAQLDASYRTALGVDRFDSATVADVLVDLERRIHGDFHVISQDGDRIVFGNRACPFAEHVDGQPTLCMITSTVFGRIVSEHLGYAKVELRETIAEGHGRCTVDVHLRPGPHTDTVPGRVYYRAID
jgi:predicted ArsR family transcriptional regulator